MIGKEPSLEAKAKMIKKFTKWTVIKDYCMVP